MAVIVRAVAQTIAQNIHIAPDAHVPERLENRVVERSGSRQIGNGYGDVIEHGLERCQNVATGGNLLH
jgi:hypothetical protein